MKKNFLNLISIICLLFVVVNCGQSGESNNNETDLPSKSFSKRKLKKEVTEFVYPLPSPFELSKTMKEIGAQYVFEMLNPVDNVDNYFTEEEKSLNLGVYSADLCYSMVFNMDSDAKMFMKTSKYLLSDLGIKIQIDNYLQEDVTKSFKNKDTLTQNITNTIYEAYKFMNERGKPDLALLMVVGSWVEGLYLSTHVMEFTQWPLHSSGKLDILKKQEITLDKLLEMLEVFSEKEGINEIYASLAKIKAIYSGIGDKLEANEFNNLLIASEELRENVIK